jgi:hypothetical protein
MMDKKANAVIEYALIIGIAILAFSVMNIYIKRGLQGKVKDMTDFFIGGGKPLQANEANVGAVTTSEATTTSDSSFVSKDSLAGVREIEISEKTGIKATSKTTDIKKNIFPNASVSATDVTVKPTETVSYTDTNAAMQQGN